MRHKIYDYFLCNSYILWTLTWILRVTLFVESKITSMKCNVSSNLEQKQQVLQSCDKSNSQSSFTNLFISTYEAEKENSTIMVINYFRFWLVKTAFKLQFYWLILWFNLLINLVKTFFYHDQAMRDQVSLVGTSETNLAKLIY